MLQPRIAVGSSAVICSDATDLYMLQLLQECMVYCCALPGDLGFAQVVISLVGGLVASLHTVCVPGTSSDLALCCRRSLNIALLGPGWHLHCNCCFAGFEFACGQRQVMAAVAGVAVLCKYCLYAAYSDMICAYLTCSIFVP